MGGDGGTVTSNRRYLRGAGSASHTADAKRGGSSADDAAAERERLRQTMTTCAITGAALDLRPESGNGSGGGGGGADGAVSGGGIMACPYGRLYGREAAVEALLRRREAQQQQQQQAPKDGQDQPEPDVGWHVRGLKDLHPVRFRVVKQDDGGQKVNNSNKGGGYVAACPMTGVELTGTMPAYLIVRKKDKKKNGKDKTKSGGGGEPTTANERDAEPNVLSERVIREVGADSLQEEYGPFDEADCIRLAPPSAGGVFDKIKSVLEGRREEERLAKKAKKNKGESNGSKKRKKGGKDDGGTSSSTAVVTSSSAKSKGGGAAMVPSGSHLKRPKQGNGGLAQAARSSVATAVASNPVLSSLFTDSKRTASLTEKEKKDNLLTRNC